MNGEMPKNSFFAKKQECQGIKWKDQHSVFLHSDFHARRNSYFQEESSFCYGKLPVKLDNDECEKIYSFIHHPYDEDMKQMKDRHSSEVSEIAENAGKVLTNEYKVDEPLCST
ncbi:Kinesin- protein 11 [Datura stramonium]|uniref:Kinesin- protein 11 n=1 Tax=Datura stramonium TaxID=4076 RepID=A0ABS8WJZ9_DATST|nr:Kinesin- protein 11 [Datura stramonium]